MILQRQTDAAAEITHIVKNAMAMKPRRRHSMCVWLASARSVIG